MARLLTIVFCLFLSQPIYAQSESGHSQKRVVLEQLAKYWDRMDPVKKQKWIEITNRYPNMTPLEQQRIQEGYSKFGRTYSKAKKKSKEYISTNKKYAPREKT